MLFPQLPLIPGADFLKLDFSIVPIIIALSWLGMTAAIWVVFLRTILKLILANEGVNTYLGLPVNVAVVLTFILVLGLMISQKMQWHPPRSARRMCLCKQPLCQRQEPPRL